MKIGFDILLLQTGQLYLVSTKKRPVFAEKINPRPQRPKRPMKAIKGQQSPKLFDIINIQCIIINICTIKLRALTCVLLLIKKLGFWVCLYTRCASEPDVVLF